jgi:hypothetical protein
MNSTATKRRAAPAQASSAVYHRRYDERYALTRQRAEAQAENLKAYWKARGRIVKAWIEPLSDATTVEWVVRSDLVLVERPATTSISRSSEASVA